MRIDGIVASWEYLTRATLGRRGSAFLKAQAAVVGGEVSERRGKLLTVVDRSLLVVFVFYALRCDALGAADSL